MFLERYVSDINYELILEEYDEFYLKSLNEKNFLEVCRVFKRNNIYCIEDIIVNFLELFTLEEKDVDQRLNKLKSELGKNYSFIIGSDLRYIKELIESRSEL